MQGTYKIDVECILEEALIQLNIDNIKLAYTLADYDSIAGSNSTMSEYIKLLNIQH